MTQLLPVTATQRYYLPLLMDRACASPFRQVLMISEGVRIQPGVSPRRLERALRRLVARHDTLRLRFVEKDGHCHGMMTPEEAIALDVRDYGDMDDAEMRRICGDLSAEAIHVDEPVQCAFHLLRFGRLGDVILIRINHMLSDAYGVTVLFEDFVKLCLGLPIVGSGYSHLDYLREFDSRLPNHDGSVKAFWDELLSDPADPIPIGNPPDVKPRVVHPNEIQEIASHADMLDPVTTERITRNVGGAGATLYTAAVACLTEALSDQTGNGDLIGRNLFSRSSGPLSSYAGMSVQFPFFRTRMSDGGTLLERAAAFRQQLAQTINHPSKPMAMPDNEIEDSLRQVRGVGSQVFAHMPAADGRTKSSPFAALFRTVGGKPIQVGPVIVERMPFGHKPAIGLPVDLVFLVVPFEEGTRVVLAGDAATIDTAELQGLSARVLEKLNSLQGR